MKNITFCASRLTITENTQQIQQHQEALMPGISCCIILVSVLKICKSILGLKFAKKIIFYHFIDCFYEAMVREKP